MSLYLEVSVFFDAEVLDAQLELGVAVERERVLSLEGLESLLQLLPRVGGLVCSRPEPGEFLWVLRVVEQVSGEDD